MPKEVSVPGIGIIEFPDDMPIDEINQIIQRELEQLEAAQTPSPVPTPALTLPNISELDAQTFTPTPTFEPKEEQEFQNWVQPKLRAAGVNPDVDHPDHKYDYRAAFRNNVEPEISPEDGTLHWDSRFKHPDHPNRFVDGMDTITMQPSSPIGEFQVAGMPEQIQAQKPFVDTHETMDKSFISGTNMFWKTLDFLQTPQQLMFGALSSLKTGQPIIEAAIKGARENITADKLLEMAGVPEGWSMADIEALGIDEKSLWDISARGTLGLGLDIIADPLLGIGMLSRKLALGGRMASAASRHAPSSVGGLTEYSLKGTAPYIQARKLSGELEQVKKIDKRVDVAKRKREKKIGTRVIDNVILTKEAAAKSQLAKGEARDIIDRGVSNTIEKGKLGESIADDIDMMAPTRADIDDVDTFIAKSATWLKRMIDDNFLREKASMLGTKGLDSTTIDYLTHMLTPSAKKIIMASQSMKSVGRKYSPKHSYQLGRNWKDLSIDEINKLGREGKLKGYKGVEFKQVLETDPNKLALKRVLAGEKAIADAQVLIQSAKAVGKDVTDADVIKAMKSDPNQFVPLRSFRDSKDVRLKELSDYLDGYVFDPDVANFLEAHIAMTVGRGHNRFLESFDVAQQAWKELTLFMYPAYHARNFVGNVWNNTLKMMDLSYYGRAASFQWADEASEELLKFGNIADTKRGWMEKLMDHNISNQFQIFLDLQDLGKAGTKFVTENIPVVGKLLGPPTKLGQKAGSVIEDNARIAHFFWRVDKGDTLEQAAKSVKDTLFNYGDLTHFEKSKMKRVFPFYAWSRFNIPLQVRGIVDRPNHFASIGDIKNSIEADIPAPTGENVLVYNWMKENSAVRSRVDEKGNPEYFLLGGWIPAADLNDLVNPIKTILDSASPIKAIPEVIMNKDLFRGQDIANFPGEKAKFIGLNMPKKARHMLRQIRFLTELDSWMAAAQNYLDFKLTDTRGRDILPTITRFLTGAKSYPLNIRARKLQLKRELDDAIRAVRNDMQTTGGINRAILMKKVDTIRTEIRRP